MAEFKEVFKQKERMCETIHCEGCNLSYINTKKGMTCSGFIVKCPEEAEKIIMDWAKENPIQTNADKFNEVFGLEDVAVNLAYGGCCGLPCPQPSEPCGKCKYHNFWGQEYIPPTKEL